MKVYMPVWRYESGPKLCTLSAVMVPSGSFLRKSTKYCLVDSPSRMNFGDTVGRKDKSLELYRAATFS